MPKTPGCNCNTCNTCIHRNYMKTWRRENPPVIKPRVRWETPWESSARQMGEALMKYECPLNNMVGRVGG